jgi:hypothetical protein
MGFSRADLLGFSIGNFDAVEDLASSARSSAKLS